MNLIHPTDINSDQSGHPAIRGKGGCITGSCLGVGKLFTIIENHLPDVHASADDMQLYISFKPDIPADQISAVEAMQDCIADLRKLK